MLPVSTPKIYSFSSKATTVYSFKDYKDRKFKEVAFKIEEGFQLFER